VGAHHWVTVKDVSDREAMASCAENLHNHGHIFDGIVYAVGHCPASGFAEASNQPLSQLPLETYQREINMHQVGVLNTFQCFTPVLKDGGCFVFLSSAITRLKGQFPPFLQAHYHASVVGAQDWLIDGMRHDPIVIDRRILIHRLAPAAVATSFHDCEPKPPRLVPVEDVVTEVVGALKSDSLVDKEIL
jgi:NADP-dependent 3-hydroxy acid dehydrogenase YdfG